MKKTIAILLSLIFLLALASCGTSDNADDGKLQIVCTSHVVADWVKNLITDSADTEVIILGDKGKDMHNFQPSAADMRAAYSCELLVYIGGESDKWVESLNGEIPVSLRLMDYIDGAYCDDCLDGHGHDHEESPDEHVWLSFENAKSCTKAIAEALCELDAENSDTYDNNFKGYTAELDGLYGEYKTAVENAEYKTLVFADRFPFIYLVNELGLEYYAAFPGCSSETTASFETVITLAGKVDELSLPCVLTIESSGDGIAETVVENTVNKNAQILSLDSMQIYTDLADGGFIEVMRKNLDVLKTALGCE